MIQTIGIMIGAYILTRMVEIFMSEKPGVIVRLFAAGTILVTLIGIAALLLSGARPMPY